jgi:very-short-patch-repair endonuclease
VCCADPNNYVQRSRAPARLAHESHGLVRRDQLLAAGWTAADITYGLKVGRLHLRKRNIYDWGHVSTSPYAAPLAAAWASKGVISHRWASFIHGVASAPDGPVDVIARIDRRDPEIRVHRCQLTRRGWIRVNRIPVTTYERMLVDIATTEGRAAAARLMREGYVQYKINDAELEGHARAAVARKRRGGAIILELLDAGRPGDSPLEDEAYEEIVKAGLPRPERNQVIEGFRVDLVFRAQKVVVELDGYRYHGNRVAFERDRERDSVLQSAGWVVFRITQRQLRNGAIERLRTLLLSR